MILKDSTRLGVCPCGASVEQVQINPKTLESNPGLKDALRREAFEDDKGNLFIPRYCQEHLSRSVA